MKAVVQRVMSASVSVDGEMVSSIGKGIVALIGIHRDDTVKEVEYIVRKLINIRLWEDESGRRWAKSPKDLDLEILCVSQFTLYHSMKGNKPDFRSAMSGDKSLELYNQFLSQMKKGHSEDKIKNGVFGAMMQVELINDGPVTLELESLPEKRSEPEPQPAE
ncbi:D-aminoacyl-tRNA deacylase [Eurytemora carolleeae]|uniref:D-aminoacyl-tRNA deacylase n=1 Tax=Eurytemora carolleeae TaxID=1294199 RepID=UPI000C78EE98|nr:D-aminoacyl-tRNA deacylase [Eurytemora carolleeae]|eukprot:XP_023334810.1 D-aminoacyl-tRNA deacylase-like [Eurytemora affinis]